MKSDPTGRPTTGHRALIESMGTERSVTQIATFTKGTRIETCKMGKGVMFGRMRTSMKGNRKTV